MDDHFLLTMLTIMINRPYQWMTTFCLPMLTIMINCPYQWMTILRLSVDYVDHHDKPPLSMDDHFLFTMLTIMINRPYQWMTTFCLLC